eukprot:TRINITY_DN1166_c0_g2_i10.p2 TRINITY_DN1166_c0_g2~~TRINITY_DN1166_c0_g2_i10.p2  ORF type:complete len:174 (+),score=31.17 TRINITY_DN1166_c0_g2_i10:633-1154(+)
MCDARQALRKVRNYEKADGIQRELKRMGVDTNDLNCEWRSKCGKRGSYGHLRKRRNESVDSMDVDDLCQQRQNAKNSKDYSRADELRDELRDLGVSLNDGECTWVCRYSGQRGEWSRWGSSRGRRFIRRGRSPSSSSSSYGDRKRRRKRRRSPSSSESSSYTRSRDRDKKRRR